MSVRYHRWCGQPVRADRLRYAVLPWGNMPTEIDGCTYLTCAEVAEACGVSRQTIWRWRRDGVIPQGFRRRGRSVLFSSAEVELARSAAAEGGQVSRGACSEVYLDNAASTRPSPPVREAVIRAMTDAFGNPSSPHTSGLRARRHLAEARESIADLVGGDADNVLFTSGGTEANNLVLMACLHGGINRLVISAVEHPSILDTAEYLAAQRIEVHVLPVSREGVIDPEVLDTIDIDPSTLVSIQWANSETGVVQDVEQIGCRVKSRGGWFHSDAVQVAGKSQMELSESSLDAITITSHKLHGPQGVGALISRPDFPISPLIRGGGQERGRRAGTENYPGIVGFGVAAAQRLGTIRPFVRRCRSMRDYIESELRRIIPGAEINGSPSRRVCNIGNVMIPGIDGQALVAQLDAAGVRMSQVSACSNMRPEPSRVLRAMGRSEEEAYGSLRFSVSEDTSFEGCRRAVELLVEIAGQLLGGDVYVSVAESRARVGMTSVPLEVA